MAIEAVFEDIAVKEAVFRRLDEVMKSGAILASNTSTLDFEQDRGLHQAAHDVVVLTSSVLPT